MPPTADTGEFTPNWNDPAETRWFDDPDDVVSFVTWFFDGTPTCRPADVIDVFEKPWKWEAEYQEYLSTLGEGNDGI